MVGIIAIIKSAQIENLFMFQTFASSSGPPSQLELRSSGGAGEYQGSIMGLYQLLPGGGEKGDEQGPVYRQRHDGDNEHWYLYRWDISCKLQT